MGKRGPEPHWTERLEVRLGESLDRQLSEEARTSGLTKPSIARIAVDEYFRDPDSIIVLPRSHEGERVIRQWIQLSPSQLELIIARAEELQTSAIKVGGFAIANRYNETQLTEKWFYSPQKF